MKNFTLDQWIEWQCNLHPTNMDFNLSRMKKVAEQLNIFPIKPKVFTVAGTNGKGSTVAILESILVESGYNVGSYTSPHLLDFNERIKINKINSSTKEICKAFEKIEKIRKDITLTFFEFSTLAAFIIFSEKDLDVLVLEVGLGGRLDAVNIIEPDVSIITNIGFDHTAILGNNLEEIAYEKSGIMRNNKPTILGYKDIQESVKKYSKDIGSHLNILGNNFSFDIISDKKWLFSNNNGLEIEFDYPGIKGEKQIFNAAAAIQAIYISKDILFNEKKINIGLKKSQIFGRFQIFKNSPNIILDIAHNEQSIMTLKNNLQRYYPEKKYHAVFSVLKDKDVDKILNPLKNIFESWHISESMNDRALPVNHLKENNFFIEEKIMDYDSIDNAYNSAVKIAKKEGGIIVVFGSSYTIAPILKKYLNKNKQI